MKTLVVGMAFIMMVAVWVGTKIPHERDERGRHGKASYPAIPPRAYIDVDKDFSGGFGQWGQPDYGQQNFWFLANGSVVGW